MQVDENMQKAQHRDAAGSLKFHFRQDVLPLPAKSPSSSEYYSSGASTPADGAPKETKMRNCFPPLPRPEHGVNRGPVEDEYTEMSLDEIINGKVCIVTVPASQFLTLCTSVVSSPGFFL